MTQRIMSSKGERGSCSDKNMSRFLNFIKKVKIMDAQIERISRNKNKKFDINLRILLKMP